MQEGNSKDKDNIEGGKQNGPGIRTDGRLSDSELKANPEPEGMVTKYGLLRDKFLRERYDGARTAMFLEGTLKAHLLEIQEQARERMEVLTSQMAGEGVNEQLKAQDQMLWVKKMNSIQSRAEEVVLKELDLQPTNFVKPEESYTQLSLFPSAEEQRGSITAAEASKKYTMPAAFYLSETDLEVIIRSGGGQKDSRKRIYAKYTEGKSTDEIIAFLKKEYSQVGKGFELHGHQYLYGLMKTE